MSSETTSQTFVMGDKPPLIIPAGFEKNSEGIFLREDVLDKKTHDLLRTDLIPLSRTPFDIIEQMENPDSQEVFLKISFCNKIITMSAADLSNRKGIIMMAGFGVNTIEASAKKLCEYMMEVRSLNHIETSLVFDRFGWKDDGGFVLGNKKYSLTGTTPVSLSPLSKSRETDAVHEKGTIQGWVAAVSGMMKHDPQRFKMYCAVVPPLLKPLRARNFSIADIGETSVGKTRTANVAMSMYGKPFGQDCGLEYSANTTQTAIEIVAMVFSDLPIHPDEIQNIKKENLDAIVYMIGNGKGRMRGAKAGGLRELANIRTVALFTSEKNVINDTTFGGETMRLIEVRKGLGKSDIEAVRRFEKGIENHYGSFAPLLIMYLLQNESNILAMHEESKKETEQWRGKYVLDPQMAGIAGRLADLFASILTAGKIFEKIYETVGGEVRKPEDIVRKVFEQCVIAQEGQSYAERGLAHILSWMTANKNYFLVDGVQDIDNEKQFMHKILGNITQDHYDFLPTELKGELEKNKFDFKRLIDDFHENGFLRCGQNRKLFSVRLNGERTWVYSLIRKNVDVLSADNEKEVKP